MKLFFCSFLFISVAAIAQENLDTVKIRSSKLAENIYMLEGSGGNIGVLTGPDGVLMIDDQFAPLSEKIRAAIKSLDPGEVRFLINTHIHGDHSGGNENFKKYGATIVAHDNVRERMMVEKKDATSKEVTPPRDKDAWPVVTFGDKMTFHMNNEDVDIYHFSNAHTDGDVIIHFTKANVFHGGDVFVRYGYPYVDLTSGGGINGMITYLDKFILLLNDQSKIIPGHGKLATRKDVIAYRDKLKDIRDQVKAALKKGKKATDIPALPIASKYDAEWGSGFLKGKDFVMMVAESLK